MDIHNATRKMLWRQALSWGLFACISGLYFAMGPFVNRLSPDDEAFAHEYAASSLALLDRTAAEGEAAEQNDAEKAAEMYLSAADEFQRRKEAAIHLRGRMAGDFVYAFAQAEAWCRYCAARTQGLRAARDKEIAAWQQARHEMAGLCTKRYLEGKGEGSNGL